VPPTIQVQTAWPAYQWAGGQGSTVILSESPGRVTVTGRPNHLSPGSTAGLSSQGITVGGLGQGSIVILSQSLGLVIRPSEPNHLWSESRPSEPNHVDAGRTAGLSSQGASVFAAYHARQDSMAAALSQSLGRTMIDRAPVIITTLSPSLSYFVQCPARIHSFKLVRVD